MTPIHTLNSMKFEIRTPRHLLAPTERAATFLLIPRSDAVQKGAGNTATVTHAQPPAGPPSDAVTSGLAFSVTDVGQDVCLDPGVRYGESGSWGRRTEITDSYTVGRLL